MIKLLKKLPRTLTLAVSGGVDSMAMLDFLKNNHQVDVAFFNHATETSNKAQKFLDQYCGEHYLKMHVGHISADVPTGLSKEEHWRNERYAFFSKFDVVATAHHLDDCVETWIWSSLNGQPKLIPHIRTNVETCTYVTRPFLATRKSELIDWCKRNSVPWIEDASNQDLRFTRNLIRHELMPSVLKVNPGIHSMIEKKLRMLVA